jgi:hypothetical protein
MNASELPLLDLLADQLKAPHCATRAVSRQLSLACSPSFEATENRVEPMPESSCCSFPCLRPGFLAKALPLSVGCRNTVAAIVASLLVLLLLRP